MKNCCCCWFCSEKSTRSNNCMYIIFEGVCMRLRWPKICISAASYEREWYIFFLLFVELYAHYAVTSQWNYDDRIKMRKTNSFFMCFFSFHLVGNAWYVFFLLFVCRSLPDNEYCVSLHSIRPLTPVSVYIFILTAFFGAHNTFAALTDGMLCSVCMWKIMRQLIILSAEATAQVNSLFSQ